ncbi:MAG: 30S ribosome-binding factor RbfA [Pseudomonadales bacterium]
MPREFNRSHRVADFVQKELAQLIQQSIRDPRIGMVDVTGVEVARDLSYAKVFVTFPGKQADVEIKPAMQALNHAAGFLRSQLARQSAMRTTPRLRFEFDSSIRRGSELTKLIDSVIERDAQQHVGDDVQDGE